MPRTIKRARNGKRAGAFHHGHLEDALRREARALLEEVGHEHLTLRALAARLGVSQPAIYRHFPSKSELLLAVAEDGLRDFERAIVDAVALHDADPYAALGAAGRAYIHFAHARRGWFRYVFTRDRGSAPPITPTARPAQSTSRDALRATITRIVGAGEAGLDDVYRTLWGLAHGLSWLVVERVFQLVDTDEERLAAAEAALDVFVDALASRHGGRDATRPVVTPSARDAPTRRTPRR